MPRQRITVLYNREGEAAAIDASSVADAAWAVQRALADSGYVTELVMLTGLDDVFEVIGKLRETKPDLVFNLCEAMAGNSRNEPTWVGLLDLFGIPYTGADLLGLASCLYKHRAKDILIGRG